MGQYNKAIITATGESLIARSIVGEIQLTITKAKTSDYKYPGSTDFKALTDMQGIKQTILFPETKVLENDVIQTRTLFSNEEISTTYYIQNIGLYAMDGTEEVLFCIVTAETPDEMPQYNGVASTSYIYNIQNVVQDAAQLNITVNPSGTATIQDVLERVDATGGDISETVIETLEPIDTKYPVPSAGESTKVFMGKVKKYIEDTKPLDADITLYVATTGSDITGDGTSTKPFKTIQYAIDILPRDFGGYNVQIVVIAGTYDENLRFLGYGISGTLTIIITGDTAVNGIYMENSNVVFSGSSSSVVRSLSTKYLAITNCSSMNAYSDINVTTTGYYQAGGVGTRYSIFVVRQSSLYLSGSTTITGNTGTGIWLSNTAKAYFYSVTGSGLATGLNVNHVSQITIHNNSLSATVSSVTSFGGQIINSNGTQISDDITTGISCTWGTVRTGYVRNGNQSGSALIVINMRIDVTSPLTANTVYTITGLPIPTTNLNSIVVSTDSPANTKQCYLISAVGTINFTPSVNISVGAWNPAFSAVYKTNS